MQQRPDSEHDLQAAPTPEEVGPEEQKPSALQPGAALFVPASPATTAAPAAATGAPPAFGNLPHILIHSSCICPPSMAAAQF